MTGESKVVKTAALMVASSTAWWAAALAALRAAGKADPMAGSRAEQWA